MKERLDVLLVKQGFFDSREKAKRAIMAGIIVVNEKKIDKAGELIKEDSEIRIKGEVLKYVSRGGLKLEKAIEVFSINLNGKRVLDIGASTGGFTDCALQSGAFFVYAVDVGTNQLDFKLRQDKRVKAIENMHIKNLTLDMVEGEKVDTVVIDVSFISLKNVLSFAADFLSEDGELVVLIKPQFEVGRENIDKGGIVKNIEKHREAIKNVIDKAEEIGLNVRGASISPITGTKGNVEYLAYFKKGMQSIQIDMDTLLSEAKKLREGSI